VVCTKDPTDVLKYCIEPIQALTVKAVSTAVYEMVIVQGFPAAAQVPFWAGLPLLTKALYEQAVLVRAMS
jgi:hypothetical protein